MAKTKKTRKKTKNPSIRQFLLHRAEIWSITMAHNNGYTFVYDDSKLL